MFEINGAGLRWQFDHCPDDKGMYWTRRYVAEHHANLERFNLRIERIGTLLAAMERLANRPLITQTMDRAIRRIITDEYRRFYEALKGLSETLAAHEPHSYESERAMRLVCSVVRPEDWREEAMPIPEGAKGIANAYASPRWFFEDLLVR